MSLIAARALRLVEKSPIPSHYMRIYSSPSLCIWAAAWQNQQNDTCAQRRLISAWASAQSAKTHISLGIRSVWSASSPSAWRNIGPLTTYWVRSEDSDQAGRMPRLIWVLAGRTCHFVGFFVRRLISQRFKNQIFSYGLRLSFSVQNLLLTAIRSSEQNTDCTHNLFMNILSAEVISEVNHHVFALDTTV